MNYQILSVYDNGEWFYELTIRVAINNEFVSTKRYKSKTAVLKEIAKYFED